MPKYLNVCCMQEIYELRIIMVIVMIIKSLGHEREGTKFFTLLWLPWFTTELQPRL